MVVPESVKHWPNFSYMSLTMNFESGRYTMLHLSLISLPVAISILKNNSIVRVQGYWKYSKLWGKCFQSNENLIYLCFTPKFQWWYQHSIPNVYLSVYLLLQELFGSSIIAAQTPGRPAACLELATDLTLWLTLILAFLVKFSTW